MPALLNGNQKFDNILMQNISKVVTRNRELASISSSSSPTPFGNKKMKKNKKIKDELFSKYIAGSTAVREWEEQQYTEPKSDKHLQQSVLESLEKTDKRLAPSSSAAKLSRSQYHRKHESSRAARKRKRRPRPQSAGTRRMQGLSFSFGVPQRRTKKVSARAVELQIAERRLQKALLLKVLASGLKSAHTKSSIKFLLALYYSQRKHDLYNELKHFPRRHISRLRSTLGNTPLDSTTADSTTADSTIADSATVATVTSISPRPISAEEERLLSPPSPPSPPLSSPSPQQSSPPPPPPPPPSVSTKKIRCRQIIRLSLQHANAHSQKFLFRVGIKNSISMVALPWNASAQEVEETILSLGDQNIFSVRVEKQMKIRNAGMGVSNNDGTEQNTSKILPSSPYKNTGGTLAYNVLRSKWKFESAEGIQTVELKPRFESRKIIEWMIEITCFHPSLPLLRAVVAQPDTGRESKVLHAAQVDSSSHHGSISVMWAGRPPASPGKKLKRPPTTNSTLTKLIQQQKYLSVANFIRQDMQMSGAASASALQTFHASIAKIREYPKAHEFQARVNIDLVTAAEQRIERGQQGGKEGRGGEGGGRREGGRREGGQGQGEASEGEREEKQKQEQTQEQQQEQKQKEQEEMFINVGERIAVSFSYSASNQMSDHEPPFHNEMDWIGLFQVESEHDVPSENHREQKLERMAQKRKQEESYTVEKTNDPLCLAHVTAKQNEQEKRAITFTHSRVMNKRRLVARATVSTGMNRGIVYLSQDPESCSGLIPGQHYVLCYCLHGSLCSIGNLISVRARSVPVALAISTASSDTGSKVHCGDGLYIKYSYTYHHENTRPTGDWMGLYCLRGGEKSAVAAMPMEPNVEQGTTRTTAVSPEMPPVVRVDLSSSLSGAVVMEDQPLYPGEYQVVLWQNTCRGMNILASSAVFSARLRDMCALPQAMKKEERVKTENMLEENRGRDDRRDDSRTQRDREMRVGIFSSLSGCSIDVRTFKNQVLPHAVQLADSLGVALSVLDLHSEISQDDCAAADGGALFVEENLLLQNECRPHGIYIMSSQYGSVFDSFTDRVLKTSPWLSGTTNKMLGPNAGGSLLDVEIVSGLLVPQCVRPELRESTIVCIQDIGYDSGFFGAATGAAKEEEDDDSAKQHRADDAVLDLKDRAANASNNMVRNYLDPNSMRDQVQSRLLEIIANKYPSNRVPTHDEEVGIVMDSVVESMGGHFHEEDCETYDAVSQALDEYISSDDGSLLPLSVVSETYGCGKTSSVARWLSLLSSSLAVDETSCFSSTRSVTVGGVSCFVLATFVGSPSQTCSTSVRVMWRVCYELKKQFHIAESMPETMQDIRSAFQTWPGRCAKCFNIRIVLVFDDVEKMEGVSRSYAVPDVEKTMVGARFVQSILLPLPPNVRIIATTVTHSKAFDALSGLFVGSGEKGGGEEGEKEGGGGGGGKQDTSVHWRQVRLPKMHAMDSEFHIRGVALSHGLHVDDEILIRAEKETSHGDPLTMHGVMSLLYLYEMEREAETERENENSCDGISLRRVDPRQELRADEKATWSLLSKISSLHSRLELLLCLLLVSRRGLTEHEILACFVLVSQQADAVGRPEWTDAKPLRSWLKLRRCIRRWNVACMTCGRWTLANFHLRRVVTLQLLRRQGFQFYAKLLLHVVSSSTATRKRAEERPYLLWSMQQFNLDAAKSEEEAKILAVERAKLKEEKLVAAGGDAAAGAHRGGAHHHHTRRDLQRRQFQAQAKQYQSLLLAAVISPTILFHLVDRVHHPCLGHYLRGLDKSLHDISIAACTSMNDMLGTNPHPPEVVKPVSATSQQKRKKSKPPVKSEWSKYYDVHQLLGRRMKDLLLGGGGEKKGGGSMLLPFRQVYACGKLFQLLNFHEPGSDLLRASLLMNMKKATFTSVADFAGLQLQDCLLAMLTFKEWVRSVSYSWRSKKLKIKSVGMREERSQVSRTKEMARDMKAAYTLLREHLSASSSSSSSSAAAAAAARVLLVEGKRMLDRFLVEVDAGNSLERKSEILLREREFECVAKTRAAEWPARKESSEGMEKATKEGGAVEKEKEMFSTFFIC